MSADSFKTAYLIPDGVFKISLAVAALEGEGRAIPATDAPANAAPADERNARRLLATSAAGLLIEIENPSTPFCMQSVDAAARRREDTQVFISCLFGVASVVGEVKDYRL